MTSNGNSRRAAITRLTTNVPGLDEIVGGGIPQYSFNLIAGAPGTGKTTLTQQIMFHLATRERPALHFTVLGEPTFKMLRYQAQFPFFDIDMVNDGRIRFRNLSEEAIRGDLRGILDVISREVAEANPSVVVVDSFRTILRTARPDGDRGLDLSGFLQELALLLTTWQATTFLVGEYLEGELEDNPVFTIADGVIWLHQSVERNSVVRKMQVVKMRGQAILPGLHTMRLTAEGVQVFPRIIPRRPLPPLDRTSARLSTGIEELDAMLGGGIPERDAVLVTGPAGSGKTALASQFIAAGLALGEPGVMAVFEEHPAGYLERAKALSQPDLDKSVGDGLLEVLYLRPLDLSVDEMLLEILEAVARTGARRLTIDSLSGFELALAPTFREDFRESLYRMVGALTGSGVTICMTIEVPQSFTDLLFTPNLVSFLADDVIIQRYVEVEGRLRKALTVVKMRGSQHSADIRFYDVTAQGLVIGDRAVGYSGVLTGAPVPLDSAKGQ